MHKKIEQKKYLLIVESPTKAKTLSKYFGKDYYILPTVGHIKTLSKKNAVNTETFEVKYEDIDRVKKNMKEIISKAKEVNDKIYIATDPDREGEAIAYQVYEELLKKKIKQEIKRVVFYEITKKAVEQALVNPRDVDMLLVEAQKTRSILDYLVGFTLSPLLWIKMPGCKSAGRVQSWVLKFICDREKQIISFKPEEYWSVVGYFGFGDGNSDKNGDKGNDINAVSSKCIDYIYKDKGGEGTNEDGKEDEGGSKGKGEGKNQGGVNADKKDQGLTNESNVFSDMKLYSISGEKVDKMYFRSREDVQRAIEIDNVEFGVEDIQKSKRLMNPSAPFITATLQQVGYRIGFSTKKVMTVAQKLYEDGWITYMRTDSTAISKDKLNDINKFILREYGDKYALKKHRLFAKKSKNSQEAHEAIRPTDIFAKPGEVKLEGDNLKLYDLIWKQTIASQMAQAEYENMQVFIGDGKYKFLLASSRLVFDGFYKIMGVRKGDKKLEGVEVGQKLYLDNIIATQNFTSPPSRFSEGSIVKSMEELGIGRPSTYASILSILQGRGYINIQQGRIKPERNGQVLSEFLKCYFARYVDDKFTASMEEGLDQIAAGKEDWNNMLRGFWNVFINNVNEVKAQDTIEMVSKVGALASYFLPIGKKCVKCVEGELELRWGRFGLFIACRRYPECDAHDSINTDGELKSDEVIGKYTNGNDIVLKKGRFGEYVETFDDKGNVKRCSVKNIQCELTEKVACRLLGMPEKIGEVVKNVEGGGVTDKSGETVSQEDKMSTVGHSQEKSQEKSQDKLQEKEEIFLRMGMYGVYLQIGGRNYRLPKDKSWMEVDYDYAVNVVLKTVKPSVARKIMNKKIVKKKVVKSSTAKKSAAKKSKSATERSSVKSLISGEK